jgi:DNA-binding NarL/FixJ family response regulator
MTLNNLLYEPEAQAAIAAVSVANKKLRILLADDHDVFREGLRALIRAQEDMEIEIDGSGARHIETNGAAKSGSPDIVILDVSMAEWNARRAVARTRSTFPSAKVIVLTALTDESHLHGLLDSGAAAYVLKHTFTEELINAIRAVASGTMREQTPRTLLAASRGPHPLRLNEGAEADSNALSEREEAVLRLIAEGFTNKEIAKRLSISVKTVETYKARSIDKLGLDSRVDIVHYALAKGWLRVPTP